MRAAKAARIVRAGLERRRRELAGLPPVEPETPPARPPAEVRAAEDLPVATTVPAIRAVPNVG